MKQALRFAVVYALVSAVLGGLTLLQSFPARPKSWVGWLLLFALVIPVTMAAEFVGGIMFRNPLSQAAERRTQGKSFSWLRILAALVVMLVLFSGLFWLQKRFV